MSRTVRKLAQDGVWMVSLLVVCACAASDGATLGPEPSEPPLVVPTPPPHTPRRTACDAREDLGRSEDKEDEVLSRLPPQSQGGRRCKVRRHCTSVGEIDEILTFAPDLCHLLVFADYDPMRGSAAISAIDLTTGAATRLTDTAAVTGGKPPIFSPDGRYVAFVDAFDQFADFPAVHFGPLRLWDSASGSVETVEVDAGRHDLRFAAKSTVLFYSRPSISGDHYQFVAYDILRHKRTVVADFLEAPVETIPPASDRWLPYLTYEGGSGAGLWVCDATTLTSIRLSVGIFRPSLMSTSDGLWLAYVVIVAGNSPRRSLFASNVATKATWEIGTSAVAYIATPLSGRLLVAKKEDAADVARLSFLSLSTREWTPVGRDVHLPFEHHRPLFYGQTESMVFQGHVPSNTAYGPLYYWDAAAKKSRLVGRDVHLRSVTRDPLHSVVLFGTRGARGGADGRSFESRIHGISFARDQAIASGVAWHEVASADASVILYEVDGVAYVWSSRTGRATSMVSAETIATIFNGGCGANYIAYLTPGGADGPAGGPWEIWVWDVVGERSYAVSDRVRVTQGSPIGTAKRDDWLVFARVDEGLDGPQSGSPIGSLWRLSLLDGPPAIEIDSGVQIEGWKLLGATVSYVKEGAVCTAALGE